MLMYMLNFTLLKVIVIKLYQILGDMVILILYGELEFLTISLFILVFVLMGV